MKTRNIIAVILMMALAAGCGNNKGKQAQEEVQAETKAEQSVDMSKYEPQIEIGSRAPEIEMPNLKGETFKLSSLLGSYVVLDFWASWCSDCIREIPALKELYAEYSPKGVKFIGISFDNNREALDSCIAKHEIPWIQLCNYVKWKENPVSAAYDLHWIPTMFLIDTEGKVIGFAFTAEALSALLVENIR